jgi:hypothetical protein
VYDGSPLALVEMWQVAVHPAASCQLEVARPGEWQSQHFWVPRTAKPIWHRVQAALVGGVSA